jgi:histidyl-tRNA synthetase
MLQKPKGTADILPMDIHRWYTIERIVREACQRYDYQELRTPIFEATELFVRGVGQATDVVDKEMFTFYDKAQRSMTLRPEGTASVVRAVIEHKLYAAADVQRLYYVGPMFRYEQPQSGRYRQFHQWGIEAFGSASPLLDAETISLGHDVLTQLGIAHATLELNTVGTASERGRYAQRLRAYAAPIVDQLCSDCRARLDRNPLRILDCKKDAHVLQDVPVLMDDLGSDSIAHFDAVCRHVAAMGIAFVHNRRLVRGLDYYTHTAFEWNVPFDAIGSNHAIGGGGRYDDLVAHLGGPPTPAVGLAFGIERLARVLDAQCVKERPMLDACFVAMGEAAVEAIVPLVAACRRAGLSVTFDAMHRKPKAQLKFAVRTQARYAVIVGDDEVAAHTVVLKHLATERQHTVAQQQLITMLHASEE